MCLFNHCLLLWSGFVLACHLVMATGDAIDRHFENWVHFYHPWTIKLKLLQCCFCHLFENNPLKLSLNLHKLEWTRIIGSFCPNISFQQTRQKELLKKVKNCRLANGQQAVLRLCALLHVGIIYTEACFEVLPNPLSMCPGRLIS